MNKNKLLLELIARTCEAKNPHDIGYSDYDEAKDLKVKIKVIKYLLEGTE